MGGAIKSGDSKEWIVSGRGGEQHATFLQQVAIKVCFEMPNALPLNKTETCAAQVLTNFQQQKSHQKKMASKFQYKDKIVQNIATGKTSQAINSPHFFDHFNFFGLYH